jgi:tetratricopeptide (TPR) repeat protein
MKKMRFLALIAVLSLTGLSLLAGCASSGGTSSNSATGGGASSAKNGTEAELPSTDASAYYRSGIEYYKKGDYDRAIADFSQAIRLDPNYAFAYYNRGVTYKTKGDADRAIEDYTQAIRINPNHANSYINRSL